MQKPSAILSIFISIMLCLAATVCTAQQHRVQITADSLKIYPLGIDLTQSPWKWHADDNPAWKQPATPDHAWPTTYTNFGKGKALPQWNGFGWFRIWLKADTTLNFRMFGLHINHDGASEIFWNGNKVGGFGIVGHSKAQMTADRTPYQVLVLGTADTLPHLLAIRYSNYNAHFPHFLGFQAWVGDYEKMNLVYRKQESANDALLLSVAAQLALVLLHFCLFVFYPKQKLNLYYSLLVTVSASIVYLKYLYAATPDPATQVLADIIFHCCLTLLTFTAGLLLYAVGFDSLPRRRLQIIGTISIAFLIYYIFAGYTLRSDITFAENVVGNLFFAIVILDGTWSVFRAARRGKPGVWIIAAGMFIVALFGIFVGGNVLNLMKDYETLIRTVAYATLIMPVVFSIYLAKDFARTNRHLQTKLEENELLSALNLAQEQEKNKLILDQADRLEKTVLERTTQVRQQADQLREMDAVKSRFFVNLTHEFRTPLALILGPADQIVLTTNDKATRLQANLIKDNANRLLSLINQLLDLSKLESGKLDLSNEPTDLIDLTKNILHSYESLTRSNQVSLSFISQNISLWVQADRNKYETIVHNLLSNALKFSKKGGQVIVNLKQTEDTGIILSVSDNGIGIPAEKLSYIFDRFYQADASDTRKQEGTGIGLALTKELVALMQGTIDVTSEPAKGTTFIIHLPVQPLSDPGGVVEKIAGQLPNPTRDNSDTATATNGHLNARASVRQSPFVDQKHDKGSTTDAETNLPLLLIIEDNDDLRRFIRSVLENRFRVIIAANGLEGLDLARKNIPDLVITDIMMPEMDGYEVTHSLNTDASTSHIPIIMLTAKADVPARVDGWEAGADGYLSKPFQQVELLAMIDNLISSRQRLARTFSAQTFTVASPAMPAKEQAFLDHVKSVIDEFLDDEQLNVDMLAEKCHLSRAQLHRKLKALTDQGPGDMIRMVRLHRALDLLQQKAGTVAEISYMVGFGNPANFSTSFSKYFGYPPSDVKIKA